MKEELDPMSQEAAVQFVPEALALEDMDTVVPVPSLEDDHTEANPLDL
jgi:hypothetical protein